MEDLGGLLDPRDLSALSQHATPHAGPGGLGIFFIYPVVNKRVGVDEFVVKENFRSAGRH